MLSTSTFTTSDFDVTDYVPDVTTALPTGHLRMRKAYAGDVEGRSVTQFTSAFDQTSGVGTYVALESFEGTVAGRHGAFNFVHSATTSGSDRTAEFFTIVPSSGTGDLAGISGTGGLGVDADGTHRIRLDYELG